MSMTTWAIIPVKRFSKGKSRLAGILSPRELYLLNVQNFQSTFLRLQQTPGIDRILTVSREEKALDWAVRHGGWILREGLKSNLNRALTAALEFITTLEPGRILITPTDLPLMISEDIEELLSLLQTNSSAVIVPDQAQAGTNLLCLSSPDLITPSFGNESFQKHCHQVLKKGAGLTVYLNRHIQQDLDTPADLKALSIKIPNEIIAV